MTISGYFDTAATTCIDPSVLDCMYQTMRSDLDFANPSSRHLHGQSAMEQVEKTRADVARVFRCDADDIVFTSGATEANNLALLGLLRANAQAGQHIITSAIEHPSVLACCHVLQDEGFEVSYLLPDRNGQVQADAVKQAIRPDTLLISMMHINNETGVMQPVQEVAAIAADAGVLFHVDAAQAAGKFEIDLSHIPIDLLSVSAHKFHGPKGIGCLIVRERCHLKMKPLMYGGRQEYGLRPGTLPTHQIAGFGAALTLASERRRQDCLHVADLKQIFIERLQASLSIEINGYPGCSSPYILNVSIEGVRSDALINRLHGILSLSSGSACSSGTVDPSPVLRAMRIEGDTLWGAVRISFDRNHVQGEVERAADEIIRTALIIRQVMYKS